MTTLVLIPGLMCDAAVWAGQIAMLSRRVPVMVACNDGCDTLSAMARRILDATSGPIAVVGHSMGGRVALEVVAEAPDRVAALGLLSTGTGGAQDAELPGRHRLMDLAEAAVMAAVAEAWMPDMIGEAVPATVRAAVQAMLVRTPVAAFLGQERALIDRADRTALLGAIGCPALVATGADDGWATPAQHQAMAAALPAAACAIVPGAGHMLPMEQPEAVTSLLSALLNRAAGIPA